MPRPAIPSDTALHNALKAAALEHRCVVLAGIPGIGKSLLTQETAAIAAEHGREVWLLQWDVVRAPFEAPPYDALYPEIDGVTHPMIRTAVDCWLTEALPRWHRQAPSDALLLIEAPLIGGRLLALTRYGTDELEALLASPRTLFLLPVPSAEVKALLRGRREASKSSDPSLPDAAVNVLDALVEDINRAAVDLGVLSAPSAFYEPGAYEAVYSSAMKNRRQQRLDIDTIFALRDSDAPPARTLDATPHDVAAAVSKAAAMQPFLRDERLANWYR